MIAHAATSTGTAVVFATTYLDEAERAARLLVLDEGRTLAAGSPAEIVAAVPGTISSSAERPAGPAAHTWRRGARWRSWTPDGGGPPDGAGHGIEPDLQDAVIALALAHEAAAGSLA
jgi:ABC-2 type transport system ATP-binding protein